MTIINKNLFKYGLVAIILVEVLSFFSFRFPAIAPYVFGLVALAVLVATIKNLAWGVSIIFAELIIGSFGKILVLSVGDFQLSIRMVIWGIIMAVWLVHKTTPFPLLGKEGIRERVEFFHSQFFKPYLILSAVLGWGIIWGILRGNGLDTVFFDVNNYLYFALVFPVYEVLSGRDKACLVRIGTVITAAIAWLSVKTILLFYIFSHELFGLQDVLYAWSRKMQLAEITNISPLYITSRIFMQSQIWILFGLFVGLAVILNGAKRSEGSQRISTRFLGKLGMTVLMSSTLIMSFSRSFWLAGLVSLLLLCGILLFILREKLSRVFIFGGVSAGIIAMSVLLTLGVAAFPIPKGSSSVDLIKERAAQFTGESAVSSRYAQVRPLLEAISKHPALGSGFGTAVTYESQDPRVLANHPDGRYTTTAFELGWMEMWLKIGLLGVGAYLYLLWQIVKQATRIIRMHPNDPNKNSDRYIILGGLVGLIAVAITHGLSPYLNHPLGIGVVMLVTAMFDKDSRLLYD